MNKLKAAYLILSGRVASSKVLALAAGTHQLSRMPKKFKDCIECGGTGDDKLDPSIPCDYCDGKGFVPIRI